MEMENDKIRNRVSYREFKRLYEEMIEQPIEDQLRSIFNCMDRNRMFRTNTRATYAQESLEQLIKDIKNGE